MKYDARRREEVADVFCCLFTAITGKEPGAVDWDQVLCIIANTVTGFGVVGLGLSWFGPVGGVLALAIVLVITVKILSWGLPGEAPARPGWPW